MTNGVHLNKTYGAILKAANEGNFINYGALGHANNPDIPWADLRHLVLQHLDVILEKSAENGWPMITAIVVRKGDLKHGHLKDSALKGFIDATRKLGVYSDDEPPELFLEKHQQETFAWAKQPQPRDIEAPFRDKREDGKFDSDPYRGAIVPLFAPILDYLRDCGGAAKRIDIFKHMKKITPVSLTEFRRIKRRRRIKYEGAIRAAGTRLEALGLIEIHDDGDNLLYVKTEWRITTKGQDTFLGYKEAYELNSNIKFPKKKGNEIEQSSVNKGEPKHLSVLEGKRQLKAHKSLERKSLRREKLAQFIENNGRLFCECCETTGSRYSVDVRDRTFEVHHRAPLSQAAQVIKTELDDLAVLCANCHCAIHALEEVPSIEEFRISRHVRAKRD